MATQVVTATEFKAKCLALIDDIAKNGGTITVTKRGQPMATLNPVLKKRKSSRGAWKGKLYIPDELLMADMSHLYDCVREKEKI
jgi:antitoxin (DNA-binding transcriptional repressor) of toxin-antitoxin stability system